MTSTELDLTDLATVNGGMNTEGWRPSENIEDRRGMSLEDSMKVDWPKPDPLPARSCRTDPLVAPVGALPVPPVPERGIDSEAPAPRVFRFPAAPPRPLG